MAKGKYRDKAPKEAERAGHGRPLQNSPETGSVAGGAQRAAPAPEELEGALRRFDAERGVPRPGTTGGTAGNGEAAERAGHGRPLQNGQEMGSVPGGAAERADPETGGTPGAAQPQTGPVGREQVMKATKTLEEYRRGKVNLDNRIIENEKWFKLHQALHVGPGENAAQKDRKQGMEDKPDSAWLFNSLMNKHADAMDNYPEPNVLPRAQDDVETARQISSVLPVVLEQNHYKHIWDQKWWYKLKHGFSVTMVTWNPRALGGLGDIAIARQDVLNMAWEPGVSDIQQSRNLFCVQMMDVEEVHRQWPWTAGMNPDAGAMVVKYHYDDTVDMQNKCSVVDWWYKKNGMLHYCKYVGDTVLYASENDPEYAQTGYYRHGLYPFVFDNMFPVEGSPCGFGYIDLMKGTQGMIDSLRRAAVDHAVTASLLRWFCREDGGLNEEEFADLSKHFVHVSGSLGEDSLRPIEVPSLDGVNVTMLNTLIDEMKETSGNRDFAQGGTTSGITAASAIAALQEAGSKPARDMLNATYTAFEQECELCIELMRQFYTVPRYFRIMGEGGEEMSFIRFDNTGLRQQPPQNVYGLALDGRMPVFDVKVSAAKKSTFSALAQNELAKELYGMKIFDPANSDQALAVLSMMTFEGKDRVEGLVRKNGTMYERLQQMQDELVKLGYIVDATTGTLLTPAMVQQFQQQDVSGAVDGGQVRKSTAATNALGRTVGGTDQATRARRNAMQAAAPGGEGR